VDTPRRLVLVLVALGLLAASCTGGGGDSSSAGSGSIQDLREGAEPLSLLSVAGQSSDEALQTGRSFLAFDLTSGGGRFLGGGSPQVYLARDDTAKPLGPFAAQWSTFRGYDETGDTSPKTVLPGVFWALIDVPDPGLYTIAAAIEDNGKRAVGEAHAYFKDQVPNAVGSKAISVKTPVATKPALIKRICTRKPPDPMHYISLDEALANGKPTVVSFATPLLCESQLCGPVVDEQLLVFRAVGKERANFVHVEEFLPGTDLQPPKAEAANQSPAFKAWGLLTEPWVYVIDGKGVIRARFEGPVVAQEIAAALQPLL
jgi:hypothetical protein